MTTAHVAPLYLGALYCIDGMAKMSLEEQGKALKGIEAK